MLRSILATLTALFLVSLTAKAESLKPSWHCLPAETTVALRLPDGAAFYRAMQATAIGRHLFSEDRVAEYLNILQDEAGDDWREVREMLDRLGMEPEDFPRVLQGESGVALVINPPGDREPGDTDLFVFFWAEPGPDLGGQLLDGWLQTIEERDTEHPTTRVDFSLAGHDIIHLASPQTLPGPGGDPFVTHNAHTLLTRIGGRLLGVMTLHSGPDFATVFRSFEDDTMELPAPDPEPGETLLGLFARFLQAHDGEDGEFHRSLMTTPGLQEALPGGVPGLDFAINPEPLFRLAEENDDPEVRRVLEALGLLDVGNLVFRGALDGTIMRWGALVSAPEPRRGMVDTLLSQPELAPRPPAWVPATATDYTQVSLDLGDLYSRVVDIVIGVAGDEAEQGFRMMEMQVEGMTGEDVATTLSSIGHHHSFVMFPMDESVDLAERFASGDFFTDRMAFVWAVRNDDVWQRIMQSIAMFAPMTGGALQRSEEQGFAGWRVEEDSFQGGLFLGGGFLTLGLGRGTVEEVLSNLRRPPEGEHSLAGSDLYRDAQALLDARPGLHWEIQDLGRQMRDIALTLRAAIEADLDEGEPWLSGRSIERLSGILDPDVIGNAFRVGTSQTFATRDGMVMESAQELTPADD